MSHEFSRGKLFVQSNIPVTQDTGLFIITDNSLLLHNGEWVPAVTYKEIGEDSLFTRRLSNFSKNFRSPELQIVSE